ncbi:MAG: DNA/RNA nuclease SfsA [Desulfobacterales bacterium]|nr:DNA/RNA nuclease SfsA [Desulfobacterales bacterium]
MHFDPPLEPAILLRRYKRFLADVELMDGGRITVHCPNSGSMLGCALPGSPVLLSRSDNPRRKYPHTWEMVRIKKTWVGINTARTNQLVREALARGIVTEIGPVEHIVAEVKTSSHTRLDFMLTRAAGTMYVEVKNCTLVDGDIAKFPDAVTARGTKHLHELLALKQAGHDAAVFFCVQRMDARSFTPAARIDPLYAETLAAVHGQGVRILVYQAEVRPWGIKIIRPLPFQL